MSIPVSIDPMGTLGASPLPPGWTRLLCITSNGNQIIDTSAVFDDNPIEVDMVISVTGGNHAGTYFGFSDRAQTWFGFGNNGAMTLGGDSGSLTLPVNTPSAIVLRTRQTWSYASGRASISYNGQSIERTGTGTFSTNENRLRPFGLFAVRSGRDVLPSVISGKTTGVSLYSCRVTNETGLVNDFIPALDTNGRPCLYCTVQQRGFYNALEGRDFDYTEL